MKKIILLLFALALFLPFVKATNINSCGNLGTGTYSLTANIEAERTCFNITGNDVYLDCNGRVVNYTSKATGYGINNSDGFDNITIINCNIRQRPGIFSLYTGSYAFRIDKGAFNMTIENNTIYTAIGGGRGISLSHSNNTIIKNNTIITGGGLSYGMYIYVSSNNSINDNYINATSKGTNDFGVYFSFADKSNVKDSIIASRVGIAEVYVEGTGINNLTNVTLPQRNITFVASSTCSINRQWYLDAYVNDSNGNNVQGADVLSYNVNNTLVFNQTTDVNGNIARQTLIEYMQNKTKRYMKTNYTMNATNGSLDSETEQVNLTTNKIGNNKIVLTLGIYNSIPIVELMELTPSPIAMPEDDLNCSFAIRDDILGDNLSANYTWYKDDDVYLTGSINVTNWTLNSIYILTGNTSLGEVWGCEITPYDETNYGTSKRLNTTIASPPIVESIIITPNPADMDDNLNCSFVITDPDIGDTLTANYSWYVNDVLNLSGNIDVTNGTSKSIYLLAGNTTVYDIWNCSITPYDSNHYGSMASDTQFINAGCGCENSSNYNYSCGEVVMESCTMNCNLNCGGTGFEIGSDDIVIDGDGYTINYSVNKVGYGINNLNYKSNITIENFIINQTNLSNTGCHGIYTMGGDYIIIKNNTIKIIGDSGKGIFMGSYTGNEIVNNKIYTIGTAGFGMYLAGNNYLHIEDLNIITRGANGYGMFVNGNYYANYSNVLINCTGQTAVGIDMKGFYDSYLNNITIYTKPIDRTYGSLLGDGANNITINNSYIFSTTTYAYNNFYTFHSNISFFNTVIKSTNHYDIYIGAGNHGITNLTNCTFNQSDVNFNSSATTGMINVHWYLDAYVNNTLGNPIAGARVRAYNINNTQTINELTDASGNILRKTLLEYTQNKTKKYMKTNYTMNATKSRYHPSQTIQINLTTNRINGNKIVFTLQFGSCNYSGSGDWIVDCSDYCEITEDYSLNGSNLIFNNSGEFNLDADLTNINQLSVSDGCRIAVLNGRRLILNP